MKRVSDVIGGRRARRHFSRALLASIVAITVISALPMGSRPAEGSRTLSTFVGGSDSAIVEFVNTPLPGERQAVDIKLPHDVTVVSATVNMSAIIFERNQFFGATGITGLTKGIDISGDLNGDGYTDLILSGPGTGGGVGLIVGVLGSPVGYVLPQDLTIQGGAAGDYLGWSLSTRGDLNGDGYDDLVSGAIEMNFGPPAAATGAGRVEIEWGGTFMNQSADRTLTYGSDGDMFGFAVSTDGDLNGDGRSDLAVGAPRNALDENNPGLAYVYLSGASGPGNTPNVTLKGTDDGDAFGYVVRICGDVNGDGYDDLLVTAPGTNGTSDWDVGKAYVFFGGPDGPSTTPDWTFTGIAQDDLLGYSGAGIGDANGDGYDDIAIGAPLHDSSTTTDAGEALVFYGSSSGLSVDPDVTIEGDTTGGNLGVSVAGIGDADNDGYGDMAVGAPNVNNGTLNSAGAVEVHFGDSTGIKAAPDIVKKGPTADGDFGVSLGPGGDADGDGYSDMVLGDMTLQFVYIYYGSQGVRDPTVYLDNTQVMKHTGAFRGTQMSNDFTTLLNNYLAAHQGDVDENGDITIPLNVSLSTKGRLSLNTLDVVFFKLNQVQGFKAVPLARGNAVQLGWDPQIGDDTTALAVQMWNGTGWQELAKVPRLNVSHVIDGLTDGVEYQFRILAYDGGAQRYSSPSAVVRVTPMDTLPPAKVINVTIVENRAAMGLNLSWDPTDPDTVHYEVWSNKTGTWAPMTNVSAPMHSYLDTDIKDGVKYNYRIRAWDEVPQAGEFSDLKWAILVDLTPPATPANVTIVPIAEGHALKISWDAVTSDLASYSVESNRSGGWREVAAIRASVTSYTDVGLVDGQRYWYRVVAVDPSKNKSPPSLVVTGVPRDTVPPAAPQNIRVEQRPVGNMLRVLWDLNTDDAVGYKVYMYNSSSSAWDLKGAASAPLTQLEVPGLTDGLTYRFRVTAVDGAGLESVPSADASGVPRDTQYPSIPIGIKVNPVPEGKGANISWAANADDTVAYKVYRFENGTWTLIATVPASRTYYLDSGLTNNQPYAYVVTSVDEAGNESPNSERREVIPSDTVPPVRPGFTDLPDRTRTKDIVVKGTCEPFAIITMHVNKIAMTPVDCDAAGAFSVPVKLRSGSNEVYAVASDESDFTTESDRMTIFVDETPPSVFKTSPINGDVAVDREGLVVEVYFSEDVVSGGLKMTLIKGKLTDPVKILAAIAAGGSDVIPAQLISYMRTDLRATFNVTKMLDRDQVYTVALTGITDIAGNPMATEGGFGVYYLHFTTVASGPVTPGTGGGGKGLGTIVYAAIGIVIIVVVVILVAILIMRAGAKGETIVMDREELRGPKHEPTAEETRPDMQTLYATAYEERGEEGTGEHHEVDAGLGAWLAEQEASRQKAEEETKQLVADMAKQPKPPVTSGPIDELPPGLAPEVRSDDEYEAEESTEGEADEEPEADSEKGSM